MFNPIPFAFLLIEGVFPSTPSILGLRAHWRKEGALALALVWQGTCRKWKMAQLGRKGPTFFWHSHLRVHSVPLTVNTTAPSSPSLQNDMHFHFFFFFSFSLPLHLGPSSASSTHHHAAAPPLRCRLRSVDGSLLSYRVRLFFSSTRLTPHFPTGVYLLHQGTNPTNGCRPKSSTPIALPPISRPSLHLFFARRGCSSAFLPRFSTSQAVQRLPSPCT